VTVVDASAIVGVMAEEGDSEALAVRLQALPPGPNRRYASTVTIWEAACALARIWSIDRAEAFAEVREFLDVAEIAPVAPDIAITALAVEAAERFGRGSGRPSILNLGDCFSYATAKHLNARLLFKGDDFSRTDIEAA
jgi:ribonuclease VapC